MFGKVSSLVLVLVAWALYRLSRIGRRPKGYPPGPPTLPILGNLHQMPTKDAHVQFQKWAQQYGPVFSLIMGTRVMIVLSSDQAIKDLLDKKSAIYSSRPDFYISQTIMSGGYRMLMTPYGPTYRIQRRLSQNALNIKKSLSYIPYQDLETKQLVFDVMEKPSGLFEHLRRFSSSVTTSIVYGWRWKTYDDPGLQTFFHNIDAFTEIMGAGGAALADVFPVLRNLPEILYPIKRRAREHHEKEKAMYLPWYRSIKQAVLNKSADLRACACIDIVELQQQEAFSDEFAAYHAGTIFEAGSDTTGNELYGFMQALLLYPEVQRKAQVEIDTLMGEERWPTIDDMPNLPYVRACMKETFRWMPTLIMGAAPHLVVEDDEYMGYHIPKNAMVMMNVWNIHRDPARYPAPAEFAPERYLGDETTSSESYALPDAAKRDHFLFGAGRRVCPGAHLADRSMLLAMARILWAFDVKPKAGEDGKPILPVQDDFHVGMVAFPKKFDAVVEPRSEAREKLVRREWENGQKELDENGQFLKNPI